ncbi:hypothetical protein [Pandoraea communis]|uniref:hypothetical protein n=1 Tax=Pandoraea communis TaxID=2508297 RepID=UPI0025A522A3|nr:hypothetical protein [Pandoraea communis]MDM8359010.1 hypothetical protein [Pandoraea communis]
MNAITFFLLLLASAVGSAAGAFFRSYFVTKGKHLATKEDVAEITQKQEEIKHQFTDLIEASKQRHALRTLVADKRLDAHQRAFKKVKQLLSAREDTGIINECKDWMDDNCLYLSAEARKAVWAAIGHAESRAIFLSESLKVGLERKYQVEYDDKAMEHFDAIMGTFRFIVDGVELPPLGTDELKTIADTAKAG